MNSTKLLLVALIGLSVVFAHKHKHGDDHDHDHDKDHDHKHDKDHKHDASAAQLDEKVQDATMNLVAKVCTLNKLSKLKLDI